LKRVQIKRKIIIEVCLYRTSGKIKLIKTGYGIENYFSD